MSKSQFQKMKIESPVDTDGCICRHIGKTENVEKVGK